MRLSVSHVLPGLSPGCGTDAESPAHPVHGRWTGCASGFRIHVVYVALPSRDFRILLRRVRIPGANEERSGTLAAAWRKKKEAPRPRYVAGTQERACWCPRPLHVYTTSARASERASERANAYALRVQVLSLFSPSLSPSPPLPPSYLSSVAQVPL